ncbi:conserved Plasmodium protein, unknown function [Plasmodium chabaudi chabaudi]|uniref:Uncharacterized protein n=1 Tax=Plasmodium chabaudi chabaudi TaxID=31271 RepID=A0A4V0K748_PLACU|nr:conserved Plasmodium protein, unknown function [Plasmodium chabaudi chabaudi]VTZ68554.1 conserved Plasmodium protein, unknown function [Plasmodium chabaudi chabaudi]|eukprot:XP_016653871.1 conserved Plasmodium protein, unknown function [Plasmodium chabaudi chabaudi]
MKWGLFIFSFIACLNVVIGKENIRLNKLECQGIFINKENEEDLNILENNFNNSYYVIYKNGSDGIYNSNEHFNGLSIFFKNKKENYEHVKKSLYLSWLKRIYYPSIWKLNYLKKARQNNYFFTGHDKISTSTEGIEMHLSILEKNINGLYVSDRDMVKLYEGCTSFFEFDKVDKMKDWEVNKVERENKNNSSKKGFHKICKHCLSHKYMLLNWIDDEYLKKKQNETSNNSSDKHREVEKFDEKDIWSFLHVSKTDLVKARFLFYIKKYFFKILEKKNKEIYKLFSSLIEMKILKDVNVSSFVEKKENGRGVVNHIFQISFNMYTKNYKTIDSLSFFFSKFSCKDKMNKTFFTNSFLNNNIYAYRYGENNYQISYFNWAYKVGIETGLYFLSFIYLNASNFNWDGLKKMNVHRNNSRSCNFLLHYELDNIPVLFRDNLFFKDDYAMYKSDKCELILNKGVTNVDIYKEIKNEGINKSTKTNIDIIYSKESGLNVQACEGIVVEMFSNNIIVDPEKVNKGIDVTFTNTENHKDKSVHVISKYYHKRLSNDSTRFSYDIPIGTRYVSTCYSDNIKYNTKENKDLCKSYDAVLISNGKLFLNCDNQNEPNTNMMKNNCSIYADVKNVYIYEEEDMISIHTLDYYIFMNEISFFPLCYNSTKDMKNHNADLSNYSDDIDIKNFIYARITNNEINKKHKIFNFYKIYSNKKFDYDVIEINDLQELNTPTYFDIIYKKAYYSDLAYVYSMPRGNANYYYILCISSFVSISLIIFTFYLCYKFA